MKIAKAIAMEKTIITFFAFILSFLKIGIISSVNAERWNNDPIITITQ
ncbi:hypothetical protein prwr041_05000 [Prevotella herbatica]|uniref:Uncharacterized protein n=1 Tax=Prevotella herbatica TaxID=2801997 RepID=A0ABM7NVY5_9BACT|nr:hypothetical protein prwr041_05000 [Prevotella herbatica]